jgi:hypothetical protein
MNSQQFLEDRLTATQALIIAYEDAVLQIGTNGMQQYTLDTGQTRQVVSLADLGSLRLTLDGLYNRCATMEARLNGGGNGRTTVVVPCY